MTPLWLVPVSADASARLASLLDEGEAARAARFHHPADRDRFVVGRGMLRLLLGRALGIDPAAVELTRDGHGRPTLADEGGAALDFNLSYAGRLVACALSCDGGRVGVDVERLRPLRDHAGVAALACAPHERDWLGALPVRARGPALLELWTAKEACLKALGRGLSESPAAVEVALDPALERLPASCAATLGELSFGVRRPSAPAGYRIALASLRS